MSNASPLIFDGHNDLLLHLWLHHPECPAEAFLHQRLSGHLDLARMRQGISPGAVCGVCAALRARGEILPA